MRGFLRKWGEYLLALACVVVIVFAAFYTRQEDVKRLAAQNAAVDNNQTLSEAKAANLWQAPLESPITQPYTAASRDSKSNLWHFDPAVIFSTSCGQAAHAIGAGTVFAITDDGITLSHANGITSRLQGLMRFRVNVGDQVAAGDILAVCSGEQLRLTVQKDQRYFDPATLFPLYTDE